MVRSLNLRSNALGPDSVAALVAEAPGQLPNFSASYSVGVDRFSGLLVAYAIEKQKRESSRSLPAGSAGDGDAADADNAGSRRQRGPAGS